MEFHQGSSLPGDLGQLFFRHLFVSRTTILKFNLLVYYSNLFHIEILQIDNGVHNVHKVNETGSFQGSSRGPSQWSSQGFSLCPMIYEIFPYINSEANKKEIVWSFQQNVNQRVILFRCSPITPLLCMIISVSENLEGVWLVVTQHTLRISFIRYSNVSVEY
jgi:hypothetical protein